MALERLFRVAGSATARRAIPPGRPLPDRVPNTLSTLGRNVCPAEMLAPFATRSCRTGGLLVTKQGLVCNLDRHQSLTGHVDRSPQVSISKPNDIPGVDPARNCGNHGRQPRGSEARHHGSCFHRRRDAAILEVAAAPGRPTTNVVHLRPAASPHTTK